MNAPPYQKLFWGSYHKHTAHLSHAREHGAYLLLIGALWNNEGRLPADDDVLAGYAKLTVKEWVALKPKLLPLFKVSRGKISQPRVTDDLAKYRSTSGKRKVSGKLGGLASHGKGIGNKEANAFRLPTQSEPEPEPKKEKDANASSVAAATKSTRRAYPEDFEAAWKVYPHHKGRSSKPNAAKAFSDLPADERQGMVAAVQRFAPNVSETCGGKGAPDMAVWLKAGKHLNWQGVDQGSETPAAVFDGPDQIRAWVADRLTEGYARSYVDPARWNAADRTLVAANPFAEAKLKRDLAEICARWNFTIQPASEAQP